MHDYWDDLKYWKPEIILFWKPLPPNFMQKALFPSTPNLTNFSWYFQFIYFFFYTVWVDCNWKHLQKILQFWKKNKIKFGFNYDITLGSFRVNWNTKRHNLWRDNNIDFLWRTKKMNYKIKEWHFVNFSLRGLFLQSMKEYCVKQIICLTIGTILNIENLKLYYYENHSPLILCKKLCSPQHPFWQTLKSFFVLFCCNCKQLKKIMFFLVFMHTQLYVGIYIFKQIFSITK